MGFLSVRYTHGVREYGKDFTFSELTLFGVMRHYGLQAKAGDVSSGVNSAIDELIGQADDAFKMPYYEIASTELRYISTFIVAISGRFTSNAKDKIVQKVPRGASGSLLFLDRQLILELIGRYWTVGYAAWMPLCFAPLRCPERRLRRMGPKFSLFRDFRPPKRPFDRASRKRSDLSINSAARVDCSKARSAHFSKTIL